MAKHSQESVTDIVTDPEATSTEVVDEFDEDAVEVETPPHATTNALKLIDPGAAEFYPSIQDRRTEAEIPPHISVKNLVGRPILIASKTDQKAALPDTGELRNGYFCACLFVDDKTSFTTWIGQTALVRDLSQVSVPFRTTIVRHGRTYRFE